MPRCDVNSRFLFIFNFSVMEAYLACTAVSCSTTTVDEDTHFLCHIEDRAGAIPGEGALTSLEV